MTFRLVVLISGNGSNLQAIIDAIASGVIANTTISLVVSNRKDAYGLQRYVFVWAFLLLSVFLGFVFSFMIPFTRPEKRMERLRLLQMSLDDTI